MILYDEERDEVFEPESELEKDGFYSDFQRCMADYALTEKDFL